MLYTVSEMAKRLGVAPSTLRYYDKEGLLPFIERSDGGIRTTNNTDDCGNDPENTIDLFTFLFCFHGLQRSPSFLFVGKRSL